MCFFFLFLYHFRPDKIPLIPIPRSALKKKQEEKERMSRMSVQSLHPNVVGGGAGSSLTSPSASVLSGGGARRKRDKSPMAKATGSFFEAMSTSWFGGSAK